MFELRNIFQNVLEFFVFEFQGAGMIQWQGKWWQNAMGNDGICSQRFPQGPAQRTVSRGWGVVRMSGWQASFHGVNDKNGCKWMWVFPKIGIYPKMDGL